MRTVISLTLGILLAYAAGSVLGTQVVLNNVAAMGLEVTLAMRWSSSVSDLAGLAGTLLPLMAIALLPGWLILDWLGRRPTMRIAPAWVHPDGRCRYRGTASNTQLGVRRRRLCAGKNVARPVGAVGSGRLGRSGRGVLATPVAEELIRRERDSHFSHCSVNHCRRQTPIFGPNMSLVCRWTSSANTGHTVCGAVLTGSHQP